MPEVDFPSIAKELFIRPLPPKNEWGSEFPNNLFLPLTKDTTLRYGANPHQKAATYSLLSRDGETLLPSLTRGLQQLWGRDWPAQRYMSKGLSGTNVGDIDAAIEAIRWLKDPAAVVIKHHNPCGIAIAQTVDEAVRRAIAADPSSAFGGILGVNRTVTPEMAEEIHKFKTDDNSNIDAVVAPAYKQDALKILRGVRTNMNVYRCGPISRQRDTPSQLMVYPGGTFVLQEWSDDYISPTNNWDVVTEAKPTELQARQMLLGWAFVTSIKSNAMLVPDPELPMTRGIGTGQTSRVRSTEIAISMAGEHVEDGIMVSDGFIPFPDNMDRMIQSGVSVLVQPGGSQFDRKALKMANDAGMVMVKTGQRAFRH